MKTMTGRWPTVLLGDLLSGIDAGKNVRCEERPPRPDERGIVKISSVTWGTFDPKASKTPTMRTALDEASLIQVGDFLISRANTLDLVGSCVIVDKLSHQNLYLSDKVLRLRFKEPVQRWVLHYLRSPQGREQIEGLATGNQLSMRNIGQASLKAINLPFPGPTERADIVSKLDLLNHRSKTAREELAMVPRVVERYKQAILAAAFSGEMTAEWRRSTSTRPVATDRSHIDSRVGDLPQLPAAWGWTNVGGASAVSGGLTKNAKRAALRLKLPYLRVANVYANELRLDDVHEIGCTASEADRALLQDGDLLVVEGNGSIDQLGRVALWEGQISRCLHQNHIIRVRPREGLVSKFALYWLLSPVARDAIKSVASSSSGLHTLSISKIEGLPIPIAPPEEMAEIVSRIEASFVRVNRLAEEVLRASALLERLEQATLSKAFRGELVAG